MRTNLRNPLLLHVVLGLTLGLAHAAFGQDLVAKGGAKAPTPAPAPEDQTRKFEDPEALGMTEEAEGEAQVTDKAGTQLPLDATFDMDDGTKVRLGDVIRPHKPFLLQFVYFRCPSLCNVALDHTVELIERMPQRPGDEFDVVTISINPQETASLARMKKAAYLEALDKQGKEGIAKGWHFLTGSRAQIQSVAKAAGFGYRFDTKSQEYAHGAALFVVTPEGVVSRTLYGTYQQPKTTWLSLVEAADGRIGSPADKILLYCYHFDAGTGQYTAHVMNIVRASCLLMVLLLGGTVFTWFRQERQQAKTQPTPPEQEAAEASRGGDA